MAEKCVSCWWATWLRLSYKCNGWIKLVMDYPRTEPRSSSSQQSRSHFYKQLTNTAFYGEKGQSQECEANRQIKWICFYCFETDIQINVPLAWDYNFRPLAHKEKQCNTNGNGLHLAQGDITSSTAVVHATLQDKKYDIGRISALRRWGDFKLQI